MEPELVLVRKSDLAAMTEHILCLENRLRLLEKRVSQHISNIEYAHMI